MSSPNRSWSAIWHRWKLFLLDHYLRHSPARAAAVLYAKTRDLAQHTILADILSSAQRRGGIGEGLGSMGWDAPTVHSH